MLAMLFWGWPRQPVPKDEAQAAAARALAWANNPFDRRARARWENHDRKLAGINRRVRYLDEHGTRSVRLKKPGRLRKARRLVQEDEPR